MFDKYFGFLKSHDEDSILDTLLEHSKIDSEELNILSQMIMVLIKKDSGNLKRMHDQIQSINDDNVKVFETVTDHIIQSNFDFQKQYDLLRLQQRIDAISGLIIATAKRILIIQKIDADIPIELHHPIQQLIDRVIESQYTFIKALEKFQTSRRDVIKLIHLVEEQENMVDNIRTESLETLFTIANNGTLRMGDTSAIEGLIEYIEDISDAIKSATTSLDWLLLH